MSITTYCKIPNIPILTGITMICRTKGATKRALRNVVRASAITQGMISAKNCGETFGCWRGKPQIVRFYVNPCFSNYGLVLTFKWQNVLQNIEILTGNTEKEEKKLDFACKSALLYCFLPFCTVLAPAPFCGILSNRLFSLIAPKASILVYHSRPSRVLLFEYHRLSSWWN